MSGERNGGVDEEITPIPDMLEEGAFAELSTPHALECLHRGQMFIYGKVAKVQTLVVTWQKTFDNRTAAIVEQTAEQTAERIKDKIMLELVAHANRVKNTQERVEALENHEKTQDDTIDKVRDSKTVIITQQTKANSDSPPSAMPSALVPYWKNKTVRNWFLFGTVVFAAVGWAVKTYVEAIAALAK